MLSSSESDSEEDERLRQAVDSSLINDAMFNPSKDYNKPDVKSTTPKSSIKINLKSERYLDIRSDDNENSIHVSKLMQDHIWKRLSCLIETKIEFVNICGKNSKQTPKNIRKRNFDGIRLLRGFKEIICDVQTTKKARIQKRPSIKRNQIENATITEKEMIAQAAVSYEHIFSAAETRFWRKPKKENIKYFCEKNKMLYLVEQPNEFTLARRNNNWAK